MDTDLTDSQAITLSSPILEGQELMIDGGRFHLLEMIARGRKGVVWKATAPSGAPRAVKLAASADYSDKPLFAELTRASKLEPYDCFARLDRAARIVVEGVSVIALVSDWVAGQTLESMLNDHAEMISADLIRSYVDAITDALGALLANELCHDDLNFGNVIAADPPAGIKQERIRFKVIDLGSLKPRQQHDPEKKHGIDDLRSVALHLAALHNVARRRPDISPRERVFLGELKPIIALILDEDPGKRLADPETLNLQVEEAWQRTSSTGSPRVGTPFEYISADQIADDAVLLKLFADSLPWLESVNSATAQIVTGPRGCGKSTVFRWLALRTHLVTAETDMNLNKRLPNISGFYVSAGAELQSRIGWLKDAPVVQSLQPDIIHLFNLLLIREVVKTLALVEEGTGSLTDLNIDTTAGPRMAEFISGEVVFDRPQLFHGVGLLRQVSRLLNKHIFDTHQRLVRRKVADIPRSTAITLMEFSRLVSDAVPFFQQHPIVFLVDDFSTHRVPQPVQEVLHDVIWLRADSHTFKLSAEKNGVYVTKHGGLTAELAREYIEVDCGAIALQETSQAALHRFAVELLDARLRACEYAADARTLLGDSDWGSWTETGTVVEHKRTLARFLRDYADSSTAGQKPSAYFGVECIADLCSGDVAALLLVYERIFRLGQVRTTTTRLIPRRTQHRAIVTVSRQLVTQLRDYYGSGRQLHAFADRFGVFVSEVLRKAPRQGSALEPVEIPRIEVDGYAAALDAIEADERACELYDELLRRAVLIHIDPGSARHEHHTTSLRLHLRKIYLPSFGAALGKNRALVLKPDEFVFALRNPEEAFGVFLQRHIGGKRARTTKTSNQAAIPGVL